MWRYRRFLLIAALLVLVLPFVSFSRSWTYKIIKDVQLRESMDWWNPSVRAYAMNCIKPEDEGDYSIAQICDIFDTVKPVDYGGKWVYVSDPYPVGFNFTPASETIAMGLRGDCDDYAVLLAALIKDIGGSPRIVVTQNHAYAEVYLCQKDDTELLQGDINYIENRYTTHIHDAVVADYNGSVWLNLDWSAPYPGGPFAPDNGTVSIIYPLTKYPPSLTDILSGQ